MYKNPTYRQLICKILECVQNLDAEANIQITYRDQDQVYIGHRNVPIHCYGFGLKIEDQEIAKVDISYR